MAESFDRYTEDHGADCFKETLQWGTGGAIAGALWGTAEAAFMEPVKTAMPLIVPALGIVAKNTVFYASVAGVFGATSCAVSGLRDKDDYVGRGIAGCAAGLAFGLKSGRWSVACGMCAGLGLIAAVQKHTGVSFIPTRSKQSKEYP
ncbi:NADH dehydrogenase [ubiquinone] 1 alpha subcomplex subunit 11-like [Corticium candelabrum]|uniref:NADH dehydrogenase [ubiquinone] 1 alpha subcomplex subunit 11-like n=1 Tax=Corticium candelabrum TaxID=121492 RepID=UPI002E257360|nr:NADH dehydrogenase [ubiquinone] 1 alpha subcomplex subunit 11-like [Corticium candelabrum]